MLSQWLENWVKISKFINIILTSMRFSNKLAEKTQNLNLSRIRFPTIRNAKTYRKGLSDVFGGERDSG